MNNSGATQLLNYLAQQEPMEVQNWFEQVLQHQLEVPSHFNWLGLAEAASLNARVKNDLNWAKVAVHIYDYLEQTADSREKMALSLSSMNLRAYFIGKFGVVRGDVVLDLSRIVQWFIAGLPLSIEQATEDANRWMDLTIERIRALRDLKNQLAVFEGLANNNLLENYPELNNWLQLRSKLP
ncbi:hypothetical protein WA1_48900 [Scytonema hofmannii PCC 7110]|uniref:Uncharacterized protein n=1 Tax=Scytonema hofmannii PCC 7110 TaxID=128403 RepID=A0A139WU40_9CYAN|nr:hypothetical protein [Scytonema hofmannii]KYC35939.1 hypothetical protein WA1_48900 [Scytonema hofmannii PCC 7110]